VSVLDDILEGVRADITARQRTAPLERLKEAASRATVPRDVMAACAARASPSSPR